MSTRRARDNPDFGRIDNATAKRLFGRYMGSVSAVAALYPACERDDLLQLGRVAILEGYLSCKPELSSEGHWIRRVVYWRLTEAMNGSHWLQSEVESLGTDPQILNGANPEEQFWRATALTAVGVLGPRHRAIVDGRMRGETMEEIGDTLGLSPQRVHVESKKAFRILRNTLESDDPALRPQRVAAQ